MKYQIVETPEGSMVMPNDATRLIQIAPAIKTCIYKSEISRVPNTFKIIELEYEKAETISDGCEYCLSCGRRLHNDTEG